MLILALADQHFAVVAGLYARIDGINLPVACDAPMLIFERLRE
jgi:hypothetical protein